MTQRGEGVLIPYSSGDYHFRQDSDAGRLVRLPIEKRDMGDWEGNWQAYRPPNDVPKDALILDVGGEEGDTMVMFFEHGYANLRVVEPFQQWHENLIHNAEILRSLGCKVELCLERVQPKHLEGVAFEKWDAEGAEWEPWVNLIGGGIPWGGELHMGHAPQRDDRGTNDYYCSIGLFRGDGKSHFRQLEAHNMEKHNWSFYEEP